MSVRETALLGRLGACLRTAALVACNLYSIITNRAAIIALFRVVNGDLSENSVLKALPARTRAKAKFIEAFELYRSQSRIKGELAYHRQLSEKHNYRHNLNLRRF